MFLLIFFSQLDSLAQTWFPNFFWHGRIETKRVCGGPWTAEKEVLSSDLKVHSCTPQGWVRNLNTAEMKVIEITLQEKKELCLWWKMKRYAKALPAEIVVPYQGAGKITQIRSLCPSFSLSCLASSQWAIIYLLKQHRNGYFRAIFCLIMEP